LQHFSIDELLTIASGLGEDKNHAHMEEAKLELKVRGLSEKEIEERCAQHLAATDRTRKKIVSRLGFGWKIFAFILPIPFVSFIILYWRKTGYLAKSLEMRSWMLYGLLFYTILMVLIGLLGM
jgi:hypothetical protein